MDFKICSDIGECKALWNLFSSNERLFDIWEFRACFFNKLEHEPYFIAGYSGKDIEGVIPLVLHKKKGAYNYFGGWFTAERNRLYVKDRTKLKQFLEQCPNNTLIEGLDPDEGNDYHFQDDEFTHYLNLSEYNFDFDTYIKSLDKKRQKNLKRELKSIPEYNMHINRIKDCKKLVEFSIKGFEDESQFNDKSVSDGISRLAKLANERGCLDMVSLEINGKVEAVDIGIILNGTYSSLIGSSNYQKIPNLGKLMTAIDIKQAISKKAKLIEFGATADHWKSMWRFRKDMLLKFEKKAND